MDDLEFRRRILSDPKHKDEEIRQALADNSSNQKFVEDVLDLDDKIRQAMNIEVPEDLADKILFNLTSNAVEDKVIKQSFARKAMALAASVAFTAGLLVGQVNWGKIFVTPAQATLADTAIEHILHEEPFVRHLDEDVPSGFINAKLAPMQFQFNNNFPYHVYYLNHCGFGESNAVHMVFRGTKGKVTLFITGIPSEKTIDFDKNGLSGIIQPINAASLILVGQRGEDMHALARELTRLIQPM